MLGTNDRFVFDAGTCSFQTLRGQKITLNGRVSWSRPLASIHPMVANLLAEHLQTHLGCAIVVVHDPKGFKLVFQTTPNPWGTRDVPTFTITETMIVKIAMQIDRDPPEMKKLLNAEGMTAIAWCLEALFQTVFTPSTAPATEYSWTPPPSKARSDPSEPRPASQNDLALARLASKLVKS